MRVNVIEKEVIDPLAETAAEKIKLSYIPKKINKITYFDNTKPNADVILSTIKENIDIDSIDAEKPAGDGATDEQMKEAKKGDVIILALGDCGSCTTWIILDAIKLEKEGKPTICICTHKFTDYAYSLAKAQGAEDLRIVEIEHPIAGLKAEEVKVKTLKIIPEIKKLLNIN
ncbi:UGSC family (seleno)protein [Methanobacterium oryzae]|uniref:UGSC family (seleno)protein n=1 Tax=Methanobacterium oryzae TaxID=69540 RepID=UPI003D2290AA